MSNTRTWKTFPSNMRKGLRHYIKRVFQPERPVCSQAREGPPAPSQPAAAPGQPGPGAGSRPPARPPAVAERPAGPAPAAGGGGLSTHPPPPHAATCTPLSSFWGNGFPRAAAHHLIRAPGNFEIVEYLFGPRRMHRRFVVRPVSPPPPPTPLPRRGPTSV